MVEQSLGRMSNAMSPLICRNLIQPFKVAFWRTLDDFKTRKKTMAVTKPFHYGDVIMGTIASQITSLTNVYSNVYWGTDQRKHQSSASLAFVRGIHKWPVTRKTFPFDDVIMLVLQETCLLDRLWTASLGNGTRLVVDFYTHVQ